MVGRAAASPVGGLAATLGRYGSDVMFHIGTTYARRGPDGAHMGGHPGSELRAGSPGWTVHCCSAPTGVGECLQVPPPKKDSTRTLAPLERVDTVR